MAMQYKGFDARVVQHRLKREYRLEASIEEVQNIIDKRDMLELDL